MSLNTTVQGNAMSTSTSSNAVSDLNALRFPAHREKEEFPTWLFRIRAELDSKDLWSVVSKPVKGLQEYREIESTYDLSKETGEQKKKRMELEGKSKKAYNILIQSLTRKQIALVQPVFQGNAHIVMKVLENNYGIKKNTNTTMSLFSKLSNNKKIVHESMNDYFARIEQMIFDLSSLDVVISDEQKKYFILTGLGDLPEWKSNLIAISNLDVDNTWSFDTLRGHLIEQEEKKNTSIKND
jgi:hypothetical protein